MCTTSTYTWLHVKNEIFGGEWKKVIMTVWGSPCCTLFVNIGHTFNITRLTANRSNKTFCDSSDIICNLFLVISTLKLNNI